MKNITELYKTSFKVSDYYVAGWNIQVKINNIEESNTKLFINLDMVDCIESCMIKDCFGQHISIDFDEDEMEDLETKDAAITMNISVAFSIPIECKESDEILLENIDNIDVSKFTINNVIATIDGKEDTQNEILRDICRKLSSIDEEFIKKQISSIYTISKV